MPTRKSRWRTARAARRRAVWSKGLIAPYFANPDPASVHRCRRSSRSAARRIATTADGFVVKPLRFPGGSIGELAVNGTLNDLAVSARKPVALMATLILEAGLPASTLESEIEAMAIAARKAGVAIVGGDTKVVEHGKADGMYVTTFGIGDVDERVTLDPATIRPGDRVLLSGPDRRSRHHDSAWRAASSICKPISSRTRVRSGRSSKR